MAFLEGGALPLGSLFGIPIRLHLLFFVVLVAQCLGAIYYGGQVVLLWFILLGPVLLVTILVHELGHCLAARYVGGHVEGILLWPLGGLAFIGHDAGPKADILVSVAGPLTHVPMLAAWLLLNAGANMVENGTFTVTFVMPYPDTGARLWLAICVGAVVMNLTLMAFNLLVPAYPLDGGRILVDTLLTCGVSPEATAKVAIGCAVPLAAGIIVWGFIPSFQMVTILVGLFVLFSTYQLFTALRTNTIGQHPLFAFSARGGPAEAAPSESPYSLFNAGAPSSSAKV